MERYKLEELLGRISLVRVFKGECIMIWIKGKYPEPAKEGDIDTVLREIKERFPYTVAYWFSRKTDEGEVYYLIPKMVGYWGYSQYVISKCPKCEVWLGETSICTSREPWNCAHGAVIYCANCGAGVDVEGAVHGAHGAELNGEEVELLLKFLKEGDE